MGFGNFFVLLAAEPDGHIYAHHNAEHIGPLRMLIELPHCYKARGAVSFGHDRRLCACFVSVFPLAVGARHHDFRHI